MGDSIGIGLTENGSFRMSAETSQKWQALAERRRAYFAELERTGRWRRIFTESTFQAGKREAERQVESWSKILQPTGKRVTNGAPSVASVLLQ